MNLQRLSRARAHYENGMEHVRRRRYRSAASSFAKAIRLDRENAQYRYMRGLVYFHLDLYDKAIADFRDAVARDPAHARAYTCLAGTYVISAEYGLAIECYKEAVSVDPTYAEAHAGLAMVRAFLGDDVGAAKDLEAAAAITGGTDDLLHRVRVVLTEGVETAASPEGIRSAKESTERPLSQG